MTTRLTLPVNLGTYANDGTGDDLRTAFIKVNNSFDDLSNVLDETVGSNLGEGEGIYVEKIDGVLKFKSITGSGSINITSTDTEINIESTAAAEVYDDKSPRLGGDLEINGFNIIGYGVMGATGDVKSTVWGYDIRDLNDQIQTLFASLDYSSLDLGSFENPLAGNLDLGTL